MSSGLGSLHVGAEASRSWCLPSPPHHHRPGPFPREKSQWRHLPISWTSGVTGPPTESSKGSQATLRAHLEWEREVFAVRFQLWGGGETVRGLVS